MSGILELQTLLKSLSPSLTETEYVFCTVQNGTEYGQLEPLATFQEDEGLSLVLARNMAEKADIHFDSTFRLITLKVHSSLEAVGLTAAVSGALSSRGISANLIAAYYHDHILVPSHQAQDALNALNELSS